MNYYCLLAVIALLVQGGRSMSHDYRANRNNEHDSASSGSRNYHKSNSYDSYSQGDAHQANSHMQNHVQSSNGMIANELSSYGKDGYDEQNYQGYSGIQKQMEHGNQRIKEPISFNNQASSEHMVASTPSVKGTNVPITMRAFDPVTENCFVECQSSYGENSVNNPKLLQECNDACLQGGNPKPCNCPKNCGCQYQHSSGANMHQGATTGYGKSSSTVRSRGGYSREGHQFLPKALNPEAEDCFQDCDDSFGSFGFNDNPRILASCNDACLRVFG